MKRFARPVREQSVWRRVLVMLALPMVVLLSAAAPAYADAGKLGPGTCTSNYFLCVRSHVYEKSGQFRAELYRLSTSATGTVLIRMKLYQCSGNGSGCVVITQRDDHVANGKNSSTFYVAGSPGHNYKACVTAPDYLGSQYDCTPQMPYTTA